VPGVDVCSLGYRTDLALLRLGGSEITDHGDHLVVRSPHNPDHWWGNFLLLDAVPSAEDSQRWLDRFAAEFPDADHVALGFDGTAGTVAELAWFTDRGYSAEASTVLIATAVHAPRHVGTGAVYRPLASDADWADSVELRMRCDAGEHPAAIHRSFVTATARTNRELAESGHGAWFGAFVDDQLVAQMGLLRTEPGLARFQSVETDPDYRRRGLAGALLHHTSRYGFAELGARRLVIVADPDYHAIELYRAVGFTPTEAQLQLEREPAGDRSPSPPDGGRA
jgi:ribosomal protein S18 acetylase RimI-like enzyme